MRCTGCGKEADGRAGSCPDCATPLAGASFEEEVVVRSQGSLSRPGLCCCCLRETSRVQEEKVTLSFQISGGAMRQEHLLVPLPWCGGCLGLRRLLFGVTLTAFIAGSIGALYAIVQLGNEMNGGWMFLGLLGGGLFAGLVRTGLQAVLPSRRGHVRSCLAFGGGTAHREPDGKGLTVRLVFRNRAFARMWQAANQG